MKYHRVTGEVMPGGLLQIRLGEELVGKHISGLIVYEEENTPAAPFDLNALKGSIQWAEDPVTFQRKIRDEWK